MDGLLRVSECKRWPFTCLYPHKAPKCCKSSQKTCSQPPGARETTPVPQANNKQESSSKTPSLLTSSLFINCVRAPVHFAKKSIITNAETFHISNIFTLFHHLVLSPPAVPIHWWISHFPASFYCVHGSILWLCVPLPAPLWLAGGRMGN